MKSAKSPSSELTQPEKSQACPSAFTYILGSSDTGGMLTYVGWTSDINRRLEQHNSGRGARFTRGRKWMLLYVEAHATRSQAMSREWHLKKDRRFRKLLANTVQ